MNKIHLKHHPGKRFSFKLIWGAVCLLTMLISLLSGSACSKSENAQLVVLEFNLEQVPIKSTAPVSTFDEKNSQILRCTSIAETETGINATVTKNKSAAISTLIFVNLAGTGDTPSSTVEIACLGINGDEGEYDITGAVYHTVNLPSAQEAVNNFGIPYDDWLTGTMSQDELFPCCR